MGFGFATNISETLTYTFSPRSFIIIMNIMTENRSNEVINEEAIQLIN